MYKLIKYLNDGSTILVNRFNDKIEAIQVKCHLNSLNHNSNGYYDIVIN